MLAPSCRYSNTTATSWVPRLLPKVPFSLSVTKPDSCVTFASICKRPQKSQINMRCFTRSAVTQPVVQCPQRQGIRELTLNRSSKMNAMNLNLIQTLSDELRVGENLGNVGLFLVKAQPGSAFSAGGDIQEMRDLIVPKDYDSACQWFSQAYQLLHQIATLSTPYIAVLNGLALGGGFSLGGHGMFCVATDRTVFSMPEANFGYLPDAGCSFYLSRLDGQLGVYLGLTGKSLKGMDLVYAGLASHYIPSAALPDMENGLRKMISPSHAVINQLLDTCSSTHMSGEDVPEFSLGGEIRQAIDRCFQYDDVTMMMVTLKKETMDTSQSDRVRAWAQETLSAFESRPSASLIVTLHQLRHSRNRSLVRCFEKEYHFCQKFMQQHDMREGLKLKTDPSSRKQQPKWSPGNVFHLNPACMVSYFHPPSPRKLGMLNSKDIMQYPFRHYKLPSEKEILKVAETMTVPENVVDHFESLQPQKTGVSKKVIDVLSRNTRLSSVCL